MVGSQPSRTRLLAFLDTAAANNRNVIGSELAAEHARTRLDGGVVTQRAVRDVRDFAKLRCPIVCWNALRDCLNAPKSIQKLTDVHVLHRLRTRVGVLHVMLL